MTDAAQAAPKKPTPLAQLRANRKPLVHPHKAHKDSLSGLDKAACFITDHVGTMGFFLIIFTWTVVWLGFNLLAPATPVRIFGFGPVNLRFDPGMSFVFYLFISNVIQILLMPLIMVGQNVQGRQSDARAQHDLDINIKAEKEIETILEHLEYQNNLLLDLVKKVDTTVSTAIQKREEDTAATRSAIEDLAAKTGASISATNVAVEEDVAKRAAAKKKTPAKKAPR
jgi:uncharacterized membrane protein